MSGLSKSDLFKLDFLNHSFNPLVPEFIYNEIKLKENFPADAKMSGDC